MSDGVATRTKSGIFVLAPIHGPTGERIADVQAEFDPKLARLGPPHVTLAGSSKRMASRARITSRGCSR